MSSLPRPFDTARIPRVDAVGIEERASAVTVRMPVPPLVLLTKSQMQRIFLLVEVLLPLSVVAVGAVVWWRRR